MKLAIMQPYIFPYIGYFQMIKAVDKFVFYDDVNFIKKGWINRNRILVNGKDFMFTIPLEKTSQNNLILESHIKQEVYTEWRNKIYITLEQNYKSSPYYNDTIELITKVFNQNKISISELAIESIKKVSEYLGLNTIFLKSSDNYDNRGLGRKERLIDICKRENATHYINAIGGQELYSKDSFEENDIKLGFIKPMPISYKQFDNAFLPWLSIIDVLMFNSKEEIILMLDKYELH